MVAQSSLLGIHQNVTPRNHHGGNTAFNAAYSLFQTFHSLTPHYKSTDGKNLEPAQVEDEEDDGDDDDNDQGNSGRHPAWLREGATGAIGVIGMRISDVLSR